MVFNFVFRGTVIEPDNILLKEKALSLLSNYQKAGEICESL
ncbi:hypothetical protein FTV88_2786 [Heliorestis convoluta]|uniref:Uncharacterized protein n=1 Tax=Heliorestis convoluta TaxID=356322 RepID=A0A5Q2N8Q1_9FIRM|nr:hypothetical protein FTV88_2786 [Heliorestis convoluta]